MKLLSYVVIKTIFHDWFGSVQDCDMDPTQIFEWRE